MWLGQLHRSAIFDIRFTKLASTNSRMGISVFEITVWQVEGAKSTSARIARFGCCLFSLIHYCRKSHNYDKSLLNCRWRNGCLYRWGCSAIISSWSTLTIASPVPRRVRSLELHTLTECTVYAWQRKREKGGTILTYIWIQYIIIYFKL